MTRRELDALGAEIVTRGLRAHHDSDGRVAGRHTISWARLPDGTVLRTNRAGQYNLVPRAGIATPWGISVRRGTVAP